MTEEIKDANQDTAVRIEYDLREFLQLVKWYQGVLQHIADTQPEGLFTVKDGRMAAPSAVVDVLREALRLDDNGDINLDDAE